MALFKDFTYVLAALNFMAVATCCKYFLDEKAFFRNDWQRQSWTPETEAPTRDAAWKKLFLKVLQYSQEKAYVWVSV